MIFNKFHFTFVFTLFSCIGLQAADLFFDKTSSHRSIESALSLDEAQNQLFYAQQALQQAMQDRKSAFEISVCEERVRIKQNQINNLLTPQVTVFQAQSNNNEAGMCTLTAKLNISIDSANGRNLKGKRVNKVFKVKVFF